MPIGYGQVKGRKYTNEQRIYEPGEVRYCSRCHRVKPTTEFGANKGRKDGLDLICRECSAEKTRLVRQEKAARTNDTKRCVQCGMEKPLSQYKDDSDVCRLCNVLKKGNK